MLRMIAVVARRLRALLRRDSLESELDEEIRYHIERQVEEEIRRGVDPNQARRNAERSLLGIEARKDECRDARGVNLVENLRRDLRFAVRQLSNTPGFAAIAVLVMASGIGAAVAIFMFADAAFLRPLPYRDSGRLVAVTESSSSFRYSNLSYQDYLDWKKVNSVFQSLEAYTGGGFLLGTSEGTAPVRAARVSDGFFRTLGVRPLLGRDFSDGESLRGAHTVMLTWAAWQTRFGGREGIVGTSLVLSGVPYTVIGVLPRDFQFGLLGRAELWTTLNVNGNCEKRRSCHNLWGVARLRDGVSIEAALSNMVSIARALEEQYPDSNRGQSAMVAPLRDRITGEMSQLLKLLLAGALLLLFIAYTNVASLLLVRSEARRREMSVRGALGASVGRLLAQFTTEGLVLSAAGASGGLLLASLIRPVLLSLIPADMAASFPFLADAAMNGRVIAFAGLAAVMGSAAFAAIPALYLLGERRRGRPAGGGRWATGLGWQRTGSKLVVAEFATAIVLLAGAGTLGKSVYALLRVDTGIDSQNLATMSIAAPSQSYSKPLDRAALNKAVLAIVRSVPGVMAAGTTTVLPVSFNGNTDWIRIVGKPYNGEHNEVNQREVSHDFLPVIRARLLRGRFFTDADDLDHPRVVIINRTLAEKYFPGEDPIGKQIGDTQLSPESLKRIVGVVEDIRDGALDAEIWPAEYLPAAQDPSREFALVARTERDAQAVLPMIRSAIAAQHPELGIMDEATMEQRIQMSPSAWLHRSAAWLTAGFAATALWLALVGLYGTVAYAVAQRTREIGVRMALGAEPRMVKQMVMKDAARLAAIAAVAGLLASVPANSLLQGAFYGVRSLDPAVVGGVTVLLAIASMLAGYVPARRAARVNPTEALRTE